MADSMRESINAALDSVAEKDDSQNYDETEQVVLDETNDGSSAAAGEDLTGGEAGKVDDSSANAGSENGTDGDLGGKSSKSSGESEKSSDGQVVDGQKGEKSVQAGESEKNGTSEKPDTRNLTAPIDWSPKQREDWSKIPPHLQAKIKEREQHIQDTMQESATARQTSDQFNKLADSYGPILQGVVGDTPMKAVENLFNTAASLRMGSAGEKAQTIANLIQQFDVDVHTLDGVLRDGVVATDTEDARLGRMLDERLGPLNQQLARFQQAEVSQQDTLKTEATNEVMEFADKAEFLNDVREDMADMIQAAGNRGVHMTMQAAYDKACAIHPQISGVLAQRQQQERITGGNQNMAAKKAAASSIHGTRSGVNSAGAALSMRDTISEAWDKQHD